jgi:hypothetical protein
VPAAGRPGHPAAPLAERTDRAGGPAGETGSAVPLQKDRFLWHLLSSPNRFEDSDEEGWNTTADQLMSPVSEQVAAGQSVTMFDSWAVPDDQLGSLAVRVDLAGDVVPWVFTDAQALLKG